jgi:hypothetical protein
MDLQLPVQSVLITTNVVSLNPAHGEVYSIQHYVDRELNEVLHGQPNKQPPKTPARRWATSGSASSTTADSRPSIRQKDITDDDCCPICQDELLNKHIPVTFCKYVPL